MGHNLCSKFPQITLLKYKPSYTNKMNPAVVISAVVAVLSCAEATDLVTGTGALFTGTGGTHLLLAGGTAGAVAPIAAVAGAGILLKALALSVLNSSRKKRAAEDNDAIFTTIAAAEPASCVKQLILTSPPANNPLKMTSSFPSSTTIPQQPPPNSNTQLPPPSESN